MVSPTVWVALGVGVNEVKDVMFFDVSVDLMMRCSTTDSCKRGRLFQIIGNFPMSMVRKKISAEVQYGLIHPEGIIFE